MNFLINMMSDSNKLNKLEDEFIDLEGKVEGYHKRIGSLETEAKETNLNVKTVMVQQISHGKKIDSLLDALQGPTGEPEKGFIVKTVKRLTSLENWKSATTDRYKGWAALKFTIIGGLILILAQILFNKLGG